MFDPSFALSYVVLERCYREGGCQKLLLKQFTIGLVLNELGVAIIPVPLFLGKLECQLSKIEIKHGPLKLLWRS